MKTADELKQLYRTQFFDSGDKINVVASPGRVTLLGEHVTAAPGLALSAAVSASVYLAAQRRNDREVHIYSTQYDERVSFSLNSMAFDAEHGWANFPKGGLYYLERSGAKLPGFNMVVDSELSEGICTLIAKMMMKAPDDRYRTPKDLLADVQTLRRGGTIRTGPATLRRSSIAARGAKRAKVAPSAQFGTGSTTRKTRT